MVSNLVLIVIFIFVVDSIVCAAEAAIFSVPINRAKQLARTSRSARTLLMMKENMEGPITTLISISNLVTIAGSVFAGTVAANVFGDKWVGVFAALLTFFIMIFGEIIPKRIGERYAEPVALFMAVPVRAVSVLFSPVTWFIAKVTAPFTATKGRSISREDLAFLAELATRDGVLDAYESKLIHRVFRLADVTAGDMMTPKPFVFSLDGKKTLGELQQKILHARHSRIPIYEEEKDTIVGFTHQRDLLRGLAQDRHNTPVIEYTQKPLVVPESRLGDDLLRDFLRARIHLAIVVSEFGNMVGVVGLEDVLEEIVGEIIDEKDVEPEFIKRISRNEILAHGQTHIPDINRFFNSEIKSKKTLNGFLLTHFGRLPEAGEIYSIDDIEMRIESVDPSAIEVVRIVRKEE